MCICLYLTTATPLQSKLAYLLLKDCFVEEPVHCYQCRLSYLSQKLNQRSRISCFYLKTSVYCDWYAHACLNSCSINTLNGGVSLWRSVDTLVATRWIRYTMASSVTLEVFNPDVETIDNYKERFNFHCMANQVPDGWKKALFLTRIGRDALVKLKTLASPMALSDLSLEQILTTMRQHYKRKL